MAALSLTWLVTFKRIQIKYNDRLHSSVALATCQGLNGHMHLAAIILDWMMKINKPVTMQSSLGRCSYRALIYTQYLRQGSAHKGGLSKQGHEGS